MEGEIESINQQLSAAGLFKCVTFLLPPRIKGLRTQSEFTMHFLHYKDKTWKAPLSYKTILCHKVALNV